MLKEVTRQVSYRALVMLLLSSLSFAVEAGDRKGDSFYAWVDHVKLRQFEQTDSKTMGYLKEGQIVTFLAKSVGKRSVTLRGVEFDQHYFKIQYGKNKEAWVYGGALKPFLRQSDSNARLQAKNCLSSTKMVERIWANHEGNENTARLSREDIGLFIQSIDKGNLVYHQVSQPEQCAGTFPVLKCYDNGFIDSGFFVTPEAVSSDYGYRRLMVFDREFPSFFGLSKSDDQKAIKERLGNPYKVGNGYIMYRSEQAIDASKEYFDAKYHVYIFFDDAKIQYLVIVENIETC